MIDAAPGSVENNAETITELVETSGEVFPDGSAIELVYAADGNRPALLSWVNGRDPTVASYVQRGRKVYVPISVDSTIWAATTLPTGIVERGPSVDLFSETCKLIETYVGTSPAEAGLATAWNATTWFADILLNPPALFVHGPDMSLAITLFRLLSCIGRHPLILTEIGRATLGSLMVLRPTFLINQAQMSPQFRELCCASNFRGLVVPGFNGRLLDLVSAKAMYVGTIARALNEPGLHLYLPPARSDLPPLNPATQLQIKERFQAWYLWHRLSSLPEVQQSRFAGGGPAPSAGEMGQLLRSCTRNNGQLKLRWAPLLRMQEEDAHAERCLDPLSAMMDVLWPRLHSSEESSVKELTGFTNTVLRSRGETREYSPEELGMKLANAGVLRRRRSSGMVITFDRPTVRRLHQLARSLGVGKRVAGCRDCKAYKLPLSK